MPKPLPPDHPNLLHAAQRLRRILLAWALLFLAMSVLTALAQAGRSAVSSLVWLGAAVLLTLSPQPAYLGLVTVLWGFSLVGLSPEINRILALDPIGLLLNPGTTEQVALAVVRVVLLVMAWNQFLFYRMLYGTEGSTGLDPRLPPIPTVIARQTDRLASTALWLGGASLLGFLTAFPAAEIGRAGLPLSLGAGLATLATGLGLGVVFSPTGRRSAALIAVVVGTLSYLLILAAVRSLAPAGAAT
jgi:hypothetical protein